MIFFFNSIDFSSKIHVKLGNEIEYSVQVCAEGSWTLFSASTRRVEVSLSRGSRTVEERRSRVPKLQRVISRPELPVSHVVTWKTVIIVKLENDGGADTSQLASNPRFYNGTVYRGSLIKNDKKCFR